MVRKALGRLLESPSPALSAVVLGPTGVPVPEGPSVRHVAGEPFDGSEASAGRSCLAAIREAVRLSLAGEVDGVVTGPIHKPALRAAGARWPGHTEMLRELSGAPEVGMLLTAERRAAGTPLRVLLATTHLALREVPGVLDADRDLLVRQGMLLDRALREDWGIPSPRIAFCALNPHASDGGLFGDEEARIFTPALDRLAGAGVLAVGPLPADTVFARALRGDFDAVVAPYHDVGMAAFKTATFGSGVNVTLGLTFVRTSPDHGTGFDIAGQGVADEGSMVEALWLAARLALGRRRRAQARL